MKFSEYAKYHDPSSILFREAIDIVYDKGDGITEHLNRLSIEARRVYLVKCLDGEIHNGGFDQLFCNSLGNHCYKILESLEYLKATNSLKLLKEAMSYFPNSIVPEGRQKRAEIWIPISENTKVTDSLNILDKEFYEYKDNLTNLLDQYIKNNPNATLRA